MFGGCLDIDARSGRIRWREVPPSYRLVFLKATQGTRYVDPQYDFNLQGAEGSGRLVIPYHRVSAEPPEQQADHFTRTTGLRSSAPVMLAWDDPWGATDRAPARIVEALAKSLEVTTRRLPLLRYAQSPPSSAIARYPWFEPDEAWTTEDDWLFRGESITGVVPGIARGRVGHVWWNGSADELENFHRTGALPEPGAGAVAAAGGGDVADRGLTR